MTHLKLGEKEATKRVLEDTDPYRGQTPKLMWYPLSGDLGGLRQLDTNGKTRRDYWTPHKMWLEALNVGERLRDKRVIEIGPGENVDFRDFCVENGASEYVGVDLFCIPPSSPKVLGKTKIQYCEADMLRFLEEQPPNSAVLAGFTVFRDEMVRSRDCEKQGIRPDVIIQKIAQEIYRVLLPGEYLIAVGARDLFLRFLLEAGLTNQDNLLFLKTT